MNVNDPPSKPLILLPKEGQVFKKGVQITFECIVHDPDVNAGQRIQVRWTSSISGELANYSLDSRDTFSRSDLPVGRHIITVVVYDGLVEISNSTSITVEKDNHFLGESSYIITLIVIIIVVACLLFIYFRFNAGKRHN